MGGGVKSSVDSCRGFRGENGVKKHKVIKTSVSRAAGVGCVSDDMRAHQDVCDTFCTPRTAHELAHLSCITTYGFNICADGLRPIVQAKENIRRRAIFL